MPGFKDFVNLTALLETDLDDLLMKQSVIKFASAAARTAALTGFFREGLVSYCDDTNLLAVNTGATDVWCSTGPVQGALPSWVTAVVQSGAVTHSLNLANYSRVGRMITAQFYLVMTGAGTAANLITVNLPVTADAAWVGDNLTLGNYFLEDISAVTVQFGQICLKTATTMQLRVNSTGAPTFQGTSGITAALAAGDVISGTITYAAATDT